MKADFKPSENTWLKTILSHRLSKNEVCTQWYVHSLLYKMLGTAQFISSKAELPGKWSGSCTLVASKDKITIRTMRACVGSEDKFSETFWIFVTTQLDFRALLRQFIAVWRLSASSGKPGYLHVIVIRYVEFLSIEESNITKYNMASWIFTKLLKLIKNGI